MPLAVSSRQQRRRETATGLVMHRHYNTLELTMATSDPPALVRHTHRIAPPGPPTSCRLPPRAARCWTAACSDHKGRAHSRRQGRVAKHHLLCHTQPGFKRDRRTPGGTAASGVARTTARGARSSSSSSTLSPSSVPRATRSKIAFLQQHGERWLRCTTSWRMRLTAVTVIVSECRTTVTMSQGLTSTTG
jgi:hypothetical protein